ELEIMKKECNDLRLELQKAKQTGPSQEDILQDRDLTRASLSREEHAPHQALLHSDPMQHACWELKREMSSLHLVTQVQVELLRKLRSSVAVRRACTPAGCAEDTGRDSVKLHLTISLQHKRKSSLSPNGKATWYASSSPLPGE
ncbi:5-azacytidine-induced protein 2 isoform X1, partial [Sigmodon hispidus]